MADQHRINQKRYFGRPVWRNSTKTQKVHPLKYYYPKDKQEIVRIIEEALINRVSVRAVGSGHSYSKAPIAKGLLVDMKNLNKVEKYENAIDSTGHYFTAEGGVTVKQINKKLDTGKNKYCISAMGGIDHQTISGAISTGTHGSSLNYGAMSKMVRSIVIITHDKDDSTKIKTYRIEPSHPFSNPNLSQEELITDDDLFNSVLVSFGAFGIIYSYVIEVEKMYYMKEKKSLMTWNSLRHQLKNGLLNDHHSIMVLVNPYTEGESQKALLTTHNKVSDHNKNYLENLKRNIWFPMARFMRSWQYELVSRLPIIFWISIWGFNKKPKKIGKLLDSALKSQKDEEYTNKGYKVMYQGLDYIKERAYDCEFAVPIKNDHYLDVLEKLIDFLRDINNKFQVYLTSPIGLRFVKGSDAFMTPEFSQDVCYIDTPILLHIYGRETILDKIQEFMLEKNAIPHWGKINSRMNDEHVKQRYPKLDIFKGLMERYNPKMIFSNEFTRHMLKY